MTGGRGKSSLFLMEQLVVIGVFALCAAVCVKIITLSFIMTADAVDTRYALLAAENAAEGHKALPGNAEALAALLGGHVQPDMYGVIVYFCEAWQPANSASAAFVLRAEKTRGQMLIASDITVTRLRDENVLVQLHAAARGRG